MFGQFVFTPISLDMAVRLVNGDSRRLRFMRIHETEILLETCAKLKYDKTTDSFGIFSYSHDGSDGKEAYESVL